MLTPIDRTIVAALQELGVSPNPQILRPHLERLMLIACHQGDIAAAFAYAATHRPGLRDPECAQKETSLNRAGLAILARDDEALDDTALHDARVHCRPGPLRDALTDAIGRRTLLALVAARPIDVDRPRRRL
ncbi:hypothetical protein [Dyella psychrodurans]|uniref:Uncharacterized protein n=1 Tax=Dyella psychrodurans TaxID=1927960 RepID=A0A370XBS8_9GAMM|nr:hypothetical protein [Dyella psychrodurans]RDS85846.1 hypothetical protein DWU99_00805 [Dyella psychrodurans]